MEQGGWSMEAGGKAGGEDTAAVGFFFDGQGKRLHKNGSGTFAFGQMLYRIAQDRKLAIVENECITIKHRHGIIVASLPAVYV
ncbi:hypothetical protein CCY01nite_35280 [Chitinophaga cymbidii]|uniref:Uncharacterized protein n=1 Tax=Chitinophaga cymbidii TaxID=1096750 RepID=A0A512RNJ2_9BACT|nr:hypothetical protein CCY01nite_35280 [Chitinophaga cymbidii]